MKLSDMFILLNTYVDDVVAATTATMLFNAGQNKMAAELKAAFPQLVSTVTDSTLSFDIEYHEVPVLYAAAMIKAQDSSIREKGSFLDQFQDGVASFIENYDLPAQYKKDINVKQYVATVGQQDFTILHDTYVDQYSDLKVYINNVKTTDFTKPTSSTFKLKTACVGGEFVTAVWDIDHAMQEPPYPWMGAW